MYNIEIIPFYPVVFCLNILLEREREREREREIIPWWCILTSLSLNIFGGKQKAEKSKTLKKSFDLNRMNGVG